MITPPRLFVLLCGSLLGHSACGELSRDCEREFDEMRVYATVIDSDDGVEVEVEFRVEDGEDGYESELELCEDLGDSLSIEGQATERVEGGDEAVYRATFGSWRASYEVSLVRGSSEDSIDFTIQAPPDFSISQPVADAERSREAGIDLLWGPPAPEMIRIELADPLGVDCVETQPKLVPDSGMHHVDAADWSLGEDLPEDGRCEVELSLSRERASDYPSVFSEGGEIRAVVRRQRDFVTLP